MKSFIIVQVLFRLIYSFGGWVVVMTLHSSSVRQSETKNVPIEEMVYD